jgi:nucleotide-binding universal stress UspA family protein
MELRNLMVHMDQSPRAAVRLALAVKLARAHNARLVGAFGQRARSQPVGAFSHWPTPEYVAAVKAVRAQFEQATQGLPQVEWHDIDHGADVDLLREIPRFARYFDLAIIGQHDERELALVPPELAEHIVQSTGRPTLVVPYAGDIVTLGERPLIAWNDSREAAHALNDALPFIEGCEEATVVSLNADYGLAKSSCAHVGRHLEMHGIKARADVLVVEDIGVMDMLLNRASDLSADLIVMGGHAPSSLPFVSRGAGTQHILRHMTVPVLISG